MYKLTSKDSMVEVDLFKMLYPNTILIGTYGYGEFGHTFLPEKGQLEFLFINPISRLISMSQEVYLKCIYYYSFTCLRGYRLG